MNQSVAARKAQIPALQAGRRAVLGALLMAGFGASAAFADTATDAWPSKPVRLVVPFPASGATDLISRVIAQRVSQDLSQQFVVDNKPGAGGTIGAAEAVKAAPDGATLLFTTSSTLATPHVSSELPRRARLHAHRPCG